MREKSINGYETVKKTSMVLFLYCIYHLEINAVFVIEK